MYLKIFFVLLVLLLLYYLVLIILDIRTQKAKEALSNEEESETDIDISDEASTFQPTVISRDEPIQNSPSMEYEENPGMNESSEDYTEQSLYPEPEMTDGISVEELIEEINSLAESGSSDLGALIHAWEIVD